MRPLLTLLLAFAVFYFSNAQTAGPDVYSEVKIPFQHPALAEAIATGGIAFEHFHWVDEAHIALTLNQQEISLLHELNVPCEVLVPDLAEAFARQQEAAAPLRGNMDCNLTHFDWGSMDGYHTLADIEGHLNTMQAEFPGLVSVIEAGQSLEGRPIWAVKISDNVADDESAQEAAVYFDALIHAREPMSLESMLWFMWWLLENYGTDEVATYLVDHREMHFIPVVNPDGVAYNEFTNPSGGGFWRKNRRPEGGCFGIDLNRNFSHQWGLPSGSSGDPCSETYRGASPFSEPETQVVRDYVLAVQPAIAFSMHTYGQTFLSPFGYADTLAEYHLYAEFSSEFIPREYDGYGTTSKMLGYTSSGTTRDWLHVNGVPGWTPEIGLAFWEPASSICERVQEFAPAMRYLCMVAGQYTCFHDFQIDNPEGRIWQNDQFLLYIRLKNRGLTKTAANVQATVKPLHPALSPAELTVDYGDVPQRSFTSNWATPFNFTVTGEVEVLEQLPLEVTVWQDGQFSYRDTIFLTAGAYSVLFEDDCETQENWSASGDGIAWDTTFMDYAGGSHSFADSRGENYLPNSFNFLELNQTFDLTGMQFPVIEYNAKWSLEPNFDFVQPQIGLSGAWTPVGGKLTETTPLGQAYHRNFHWRQEQIDLSAFAGEMVGFRFFLGSDNARHSDGFYFDDFRVVNYFEPLIESAEEKAGGEIRLDVFPNPSAGLFTVEVVSPKNMEAQLTVRNVLGEIIENQMVSIAGGANKLPLNLSGVASGVYFVEVRSEGKLAVMRVVLQ